MKVYFDNAATTPLDKEVADTMYKVMCEDFGNPSSTHAHGRQVRTLIEEARRTVARLLNCAPGEIFFTSGGTEADNMSIRQSVLTGEIKNIISSKIEHHAVLHTVEELAHQGKVNLHFVNLLPNGHVDLNHLEELLSTNPSALVSLMHANNEIGNLLDIDKVGEMCLKYSAIFQCDTVQTIGHYPLDLAKTHINFLACAAHKFNGPKGVGFIYINGKSKISPFITGGAQERNMRGGTENVYGIIGLAKALELAYANLEHEQKHIQDIKTYMIEKLRANIDGITFNGDTEGSSLYTVLNANFPPTPIAEMILFKLDIAGISCSGGSACSSGSNVGSHVLGALNVSPDRPSVRFSFGKQNTKEEVDFVVEKLKEMLAPKATPGS
ncbi:MAG: cysteine desulfurase family protein [Bacteroidota bacterium]|jgi:cysteine desulfurase|nr:cysteine desulfurase family protein [Crocinitomicaceae bacterium]